MRSGRAPRHAHADAICSRVAGAAGVSKLAIAQRRRSSFWAAPVPSDEGSAEDDAREPSNEMRDLNLRVVIKEVTESEKTDQDRESQPNENLRAAISVYSDHGFHVCEHYPRIPHLTRAESHERAHGAVRSAVRATSSRTSPSFWLGRERSIVSRIKAEHVRFVRFAKGLPEKTLEILLRLLATGAIVLHVKLPEPRSAVGWA
jgi:hypothetical protein